MPANLTRDKTLASSPEAALRAALLATNAQLHRAAVDDSLSGTTACVALVRGPMLYVANVGDSRAVLALRGPGGKLAARDLSSDQTPFRCVGAPPSAFVRVHMGGGEGGLTCWKELAYPTLKIVASALPPPPPSQRGRAAAGAGRRRARADPGPAGGH